MSTNLNIRTDKEVKENAARLFDSLGLDMSTAINLFLRQAIRVNGIPFEIKADTPKEETVSAMDEIRAMEAAPEKYKGYKTMDELKAALGV